MLRIQLKGKMLCIIDYGSGNIGAIANICERERISYKVTHDYRLFKYATKFILPGVGAFDPTIAELRKVGIVQALEDEVFAGGKSLLGICIGMHLLANRSDEGALQGLGWIAGEVIKIDKTKISRRPYLPHMGWNNISSELDDPILDGIDKSRGFYFLHSYYFRARQDSNVVATVEYGDQLPCIVRQGKIVGAQFHPEKSHSNGIQFIKNFVKF